jgi:hypothetical protein
MQRVSPAVERAGLVGAQHLHAAELLDGLQPAHEHAGSRQRARARAPATR